MPDQMFRKSLTLSDPFVADGFLDKEYAAAAEMYVGVVQLTDDQQEIAGAAYGIGVADVRDQGRADGEKSWTMQMQHDAEKKLVAGKKAVGFIIVRLPGGKFTGWVDTDIAIT